jgi:hypothetical protein
MPDAFFTNDSPAHNTRLSVPFTKNDDDSIFRGDILGREDGEMIFLWQSAEW